MTRIVSVELRNIKSYATPGFPIQFRPGVNLIWGENGSGKTTILEAIGFALFGALDLDLKQFRRKGENEGEVILTLEGADERFYQIIRKVKAAASLEIKDFETQRKISATKVDAEKWLSQVVGAEFGGFGKTLFENVLGVSQGRMIESFMLSAGGRKDIFEPILKIEGYEQTWDYLGDARSELVRRIADAKMKTARLEGQLSTLPDLQGELQKLLDQVQEDEKAYQDICGRLVGQEKTFAEMDARKKSLDQLDGKVSLASNEVESGKRDVQNAKKLQDESAEAARVLETCRNGYQSYQKAQEELSDLEIQRKERDQLNQKLQAVERRQAEISAKLSEIDRQLAEVSHAEQKIVDLEPLAQRQKQLEALIQQKQQEVDQRQKALEEQGKWITKRGQLESQLDETRQALERRQALENGLREKQEMLAQLLPVIEVLSREANNLRKTLDQANQALHQLEMDAQALEYLKKQLTEKTGLLEGHQQKLRKIEDDLSKRTALQESIDKLTQALEIEQARLATAQNDQKNAVQQIAELEERRTLLQQVEKAECPVCKKPLEAHEAAEIEAEFAAEISALEQKQRDAKDEEKEADRAIKQCKKSLKDLAEQRDKLPTSDSKAQIEIEISKTETAIRDLQLQIDAFKDLPDKVTSQTQSVQNIEQQLTALESDQKERAAEQDQRNQEIAAQNRELAKLPQPAEAQRLEAAIEECNREARQQEELAQLLDTAPAELLKTQSDLRQIGNPVEEQAQQRGIAQQRPALEQTQGGLQASLNQEKTKYVSLIEQLKVFTGLDQQLKDMISRRDQNQPDYVRYLANQNAAAALEERQAELYRLSAAQKTMENRLADLTKQREAAKAKFDETQYQSLYEAIRSSYQQKTALETRLDIQKKDADNKQRLLENLLHTQEEFHAAEKEVNRLEKLAQVLHFVRESIRKAGPQIARRRVQAVSYSANRIFRQILLSTNRDGGADGSSDPGTLNWDNTYEVTVRRSGDDLVFKQLSGGEKMAAAIAIRIALLSLMTSNLRLLFLDEPTANMDDARRNQLAEQIAHLEGLNQLFVITHDDAFERAAHHVLLVFKHNDISMVENKS